MSAYRIGLPQRSRTFPVIELIIPVEGIDRIGKIAQLLLQHFLFPLGLIQYLEPECVLDPMPGIAGFDGGDFGCNLCVPVYYLQEDGVDGLFHVHL